MVSELGASRFFRGDHLRRAVANTFAWVLGALVLVASATAEANGRYPQAGQLVIDPVDASHWVARATFGLLETRNAGQTWEWICEEAVGYFTTEDPPIAVSADGSTLAASSLGISTSHDDGCTWTRADSAGLGIDVTVRPTEPHRALAIMTTLFDEMRAVSLVETNDDGASFGAIGTPIAGGFVGETVEVTASQPNRIYLSGNVQTRSADSGQLKVQPVVERSDDGGSTWSESILDLPGVTTLFLGGVDPLDADRVYARTAVGGLGLVLMSRDGGSSFASIFTASGDLLGFALSPDGSTLAIGGPGVGILVAATSDLVFRKTSDTASSCLAWSGSRLMTCASEALAGFSIGSSDDLGAHFVPVMHLSSVAPRVCPTTSSAGVCAQTWPAVAAFLSSDAGAPSGLNPVDSEGAPASTSCRCDFGAPRSASPAPLLALASLARGYFRRRQRARASLASREHRDVCAGSWRG